LDFPDKAQSTRHTLDKEEREAGASKKKSDKGRALVKRVTFSVVFGARGGTTGRLARHTSPP
jgi:hypothetical protein